MTHVSIFISLLINLVHEYPSLQNKIKRKNKLIYRPKYISMTNNEVLGVKNTEFLVPYNNSLSFIYLFLLSLFNEHGEQ